MITSRPRASAASSSSMRRGVVVDDDGRLGAGERGEQALGVDTARAAGAGRQVVLERGVAAGDVGDAGRAPTRRSGARPRLVWMTTPVALIDRAQRAGRGGGELARGGRFDVRRQCLGASAARRRRRAERRPQRRRRPARSAVTVALTAVARVRASRTAGRCSSCVDRGKCAEVGHRCAVLRGVADQDTIPAHACRACGAPCPRCPSHPRSTPVMPTPARAAARALLALRRAGGGADDRGAGRARSRPARGAVRRRATCRSRSPWCSRASLARATTRPSRWPRPRAEYRDVGAGDGPAPPRALLRVGRRRAARPLRDRRRPAGHRRCSSTIGPSPTRASCGCRCSGFSSSGKPVAAAHHQRIRSAAARARGRDQEARGRVQPVLRRPAAEAAVGDPRPRRSARQALRPAADPEHRRAVPVPGHCSRASAPSASCGNAA